MRISFAGILLLALGLAGCAEIDPYQRPGDWHPLGANAANLRAMAADPRDLDFGQGGAVPSGDLAGVAVARLRADKVKPLPASSISGVHATDTGLQQGPGDSAPPAAPASPGP